MIEIPEFVIYFPGCEFHQAWLWIPYFIIGIFIARIVYRKVKQPTNPLEMPDPAEVFCPILTFFFWPMTIVLMLIWCGHKEKSQK